MKPFFERLAGVFSKPRAKSARERVATALKYAELARAKLADLRRDHEPDEIGGAMLSYVGLLARSAALMTPDRLHSDNEFWTDRLSACELEDALWKAMTDRSPWMEAGFSRRLLLEDYVAAYGVPARTCEMKIKAEALGDFGLSELLAGIGS